MNKLINIDLIDPLLKEDEDDICIIRSINDCYMPPKLKPILYSYEINNIIDKIGNKDITIDDLEHALDIITLYMYQREIHKIVLDIYDRNKSLSPAKEMTLEEIEEKLGHKIKIIACDKN